MHKKKSTKSSYVKLNYFKSIWRLHDVSTSQSPKEILKIVMKTKLLTSKWFIKKKSDFYPNEVISYLWTYLSEDYGIYMVEMVESSVLNWG